MGDEFVGYSADLLDSVTLPSACSPYLDVTLLTKAPGVSSGSRTGEPRCAAFARRCDALPRVGRSEVLGLARGLESQLILE